MKKIVLVLVLLLIVTGCSFSGLNRNNKEDAMKFKEEYEKLNDTKNASGLTHRAINIDSNNPFVYTTAEEIVRKIENKETFYVYFGSAYCPWCRSVIEKVIEVANEKKIDTIYYVDVWGGEDHTEVLRDVYALDEKGKPTRTSEGTESYYQLLTYFDEVLSKYQLTDEEGNKVDTNEKRIGAPNFIYVKEGETIKLETGISSKQTASRDELTSEMLTEEKEKLNTFFENEK